MHMITKLTGLAIIILFFSACEKIEGPPRTAVSVDTTAYYAAFKKTEADDWRFILKDNSNFTPKGITFTVGKDDPLGIVFVCPAIRQGETTEVYVYYATGSEMELLDFICRRALENIQIQTMYGNLEGVATAEAESLEGIANARGDVVRFALADETLLAWEAYAISTRVGTHDFIASKGVYSTEGLFEPESFLIRRDTGLFVDKPTNIDFDFSESNSSVIPFSSEVSGVNVTGLGSEETMEVKVDFVGINQTKLNLIQGSQSTYSFFPVPLEGFTQLDRRGKVDPAEFNPGEGHVLSVVSKSSEGLVVRESLKFFSVSNGVEHNIHLSEPYLNPPLVASKTKDGLQTIALNWDRYKSDVVGEADLYVWVISGQPAEPLEDKKAIQNTENINWHILMTKGWLKGIGETGDNYTLALPPYFELDGKVGAITANDDWRREWGFKPDTSVSWEMSAIALGGDSTAEDMIDYLLNKNLRDNLTFSQIHARSK